MKDLSLDEIATRIVDAILKDPHINKQSLETLIRPILKIWLKKADGFKCQKASKSKLQMTIESRDIQANYWKQKVKGLVNPDQLPELYAELNQILIKEGYIKQP